MTIEWNCSGCLRTFEYDRSSAQRRFEKTTVYKEERTSDAFVCSNCGSLLSPFLDEVPVTQ